MTGDRVLARKLRRASGFARIRHQQYNASANGINRAVGNICMRVLVTGSAGLIGCETLRLCAASGIETVAFDIAHPPGEPRHGDICDPAALAAAIAGCDGVLHLAAVSRVIFGERDPAHCHAVNVEGTANVIRAALDRPVGRRPWLVYASSREVYGDPTDLPVAEDAPLRPMNHYGRSKLAAEQAMEAARQAGLDTTILRFSNVFGAVRDHPDRVVPAFARAAALGGTMSVEGSGNTFDFTHVRDVGRGVLAVLRAMADGTALPPIHFVGGRATSLAELAAIAKAAALAPVQIREAPARNFDVAHFRGDPTRAEALLGWRAEISVEAGVAALIAAFGDQRMAAD